MVASAGAGPSPLPHKLLDVQKLTEGIQYCLSPKATIAAQGIAQKMQSEDGVQAAVDSFHRHLPLDRMRCEFLDQPAVWKLKIGKRQLHVSKLAAEAILAQKPSLKKHLQM